MNIRKILTERFSLVSARPFEEVVASIEESVGHPILGGMLKSIAAAQTYSELESIVDKVVGPTSLMEFLRFDMGEVLSKGKSGPKPKSIRFLIGNPVTMRKMTEKVPDAAAYAPITILVDERADGVHVSYDRISSSLAPYANEQASLVAAELDRNVETILAKAAG